MIQFDLRILFQLCFLTFFNHQLEGSTQTLELVKGQHMAPCSVHNLVELLGIDMLGPAKALEFTVGSHKLFVFVLKGACF